MPHYSKYFHAETASCAASDPRVLAIRAVVAGELAPDG
jgi:hypothetical protein